MEPESDATDVPGDVDAPGNDPGGDATAPGDGGDVGPGPDGRDLHGRDLVLVGLMGVGKSTVGPLLADAMGRTFVDLDAEIERRTGRSVRQLVADDGEAEFRRLEAATLAAVLDDAAPIVLATGGGAVLDASSRQLLRDLPVVVWLRASVATLVDRVGVEGAASRPLLDDGPIEVLTRLADERHDLYRQVADLEVDTTLDNADGVTASVLAGLGVSVQSAAQERVR